MYLEHHGLEKNPFSISPDPAFLWLGPKHREAFAALRYGILEEKGFLCLSGEVGTGKTILIRNLINTIEVPAIIISVPDPDMKPFEFFRYVAKEIKLKGKFRSKADFLMQFQSHVNAAFGTDTRVLMIIDEAQRLNYPLLEQVRLLSNIVSTNKRQLNIFLVGQNELNDLLRDERAKATRQRIVVRHNLKPLDFEEVAAYIHHRMEVAGADRVIFLPDAIEAVALQTDGIPRAINVICDQALLKGYQDNAELIGAEIVNSCPAARELPQPSGTEEPTANSPEDALESEDLDLDAPPAGNSQKKTPWRFRQAVVASLTVATLLAGLGVFQHFFMGSGTSGRRTLRESAPRLLLEQPDRLKEPVGVGTAKTGPAAETEAADRPEKSEGPAGQMEPTAPGGTPESVPASGKEALTGPGGDKINDRTARTPERQDDKRADAAEAILAEPIPPATADSADRVAPQAADIPKKGGRLILYFKFDSSELTAASADDLKAFLSELPPDSGKRFRLNGYTDASGDFWYNKKLSQRRANAVRDLLVEGGVSYADIVAVGMGADDPQAESGPKDDPRKGRRVEVILIDSR